MALSSESIMTTATKGECTMSAREIDNQHKRIGGENSYRAQRFEGAKSMVDDYTKQRIFVDSTKHPAGTAAQVDHIIPLEKVRELYPNLTKEQQRMIANDPSNYAMTSGKLNMYVKNSRMNHEVVAEQVPKVAESVSNSIRKGNLPKAVKTTSDYVKTSSNMLKSEAKAATKMAKNAQNCRLENALGDVKRVSGTIAETPEMALVKGIGNAASMAAAGALAGTLVCETVSSIRDCDEADVYVGKVVGKGVQAVASAGGGAVTGKMAGIVAAGLGAGPVGVAAASIGTGLATSAAIAEATEEVAEDIAFAVMDGIDNLRMEVPALDIPCAIVENVGLGLGSLWDNTFGLFF